MRSQDSRCTLLGMLAGTNTKSDARDTSNICPSDTVYRYSQSSLDAHTANAAACERLDPAAISLHLLTPHDVHVSPSPASTMASRLHAVAPTHVLPSITPQRPAQTAGCATFIKAAGDHEVNAQSRGPPPICSAPEMGCTSGQALAHCSLSGPFRTQTAYTFAS